MRMSFQRKVFLSFVAIIVVPTLALLLLATNLSLRYYRTSVLRNASVVSRLSVRAVDIKLRAYRQMTMQMYYNRDLAGSVARLGAGNATEADSSRVTQFLKSFVNSDRYIASAYLRAGHTLLQEGLPFQDFESFFTSAERPSPPHATLVWVPTESIQSVFGGETSVLGVVRHLRVENRLVGSLLLLVRESMFDDVHESTSIEPQTVTFFADDSGSVLSARGSVDVGTRFERIDLVRDALDGEHPGWLECRFAGAPHYLIAARSQEADWLFVTLVPRDGLLRAVSGLRQTFVMIACLFAVFLAMLSFLFSRSLARPIGQLIAVIRRIGEGDLVLEQGVLHDDEIGRINRSIAAMASRIRMLVERVKDEEQQKNAAERRALQMQMSPHFLYNTLNTIQWMAVINKQENIREITAALIRLLRSAARTDAVLVPLREELELLQSYACIQKMRFPNFEVCLRASESLKDNRILRFAVQTLVENSILHGLRGRDGEGAIDISAWEDQGQFFVAVTDNGAGFDTAILCGRPAIADPDPHDGEHAHTGIATLRHRIRLHHGEGFGLDLESEPGRGTRALLRLPIIHGEQES